MWTPPVWLIRPPQYLIVDYCTVHLSQHGSGTAGVGGGTRAATKSSLSGNENGEGGGGGDEEAEAGWTKEDEENLHCLCRLPADTARFRTLMTCDLCTCWFHPACVRLKVGQLGFGEPGVPRR